MNSEDILVRCFGVCDDSDDINELLYWVLNEEFTQCEERENGYYYYHYGWSDNEYVLDILHQTIPDAVEKIDGYTVVLNGWERPLREEFIEKMDDDGNE